MHEPHHNVLPTTMTVETAPSDRRAIAPEPPPPEVFGGRYRRVRAVGQGGFGVVYEAIDERLRKRVAVKLLRSSYCIDSRHVERFHKEALAAGRLDHPNIVTVTDFALLDDGRPFLVMEYVDGESLESAIKREGRLPEAVAVRLAQGLCAGLAEAHSHGIIHRDLKPGNVIVREHRGLTPTVKIVDFGIAKLTERNDDLENTTTTGEVMGTPAYMAPEQVRQRDPLDGRADIYALGIILYKMLTGTTPFAGRAPGDVMVSKVIEDPEPPSSINNEIPSALERVVLKAIRPRPDERFGTATAMAQALAAVAPGQVGARPRMRWTLVMAGGAVAIAAAVVAALWPSDDVLKARAAAPAPPAPAPIRSTRPTQPPSATDPQAGEPVAPAPGGTAVGATPGAADAGVAPEPPAPEPPTSAPPAPAEAKKKGSGKKRNDLLYGE